MSEQEKKSKLNPYKLIGIIYHIPNFLRLLFRLFSDGRVPFFPKLALIAALAYFASPFDLLPDFLFPVLGYVEDLIILFIVLKIFIQYSPEEVVRQHVQSIEKDNKRPFR